MRALLLVAATVALAGCWTADRSADRAAPNPTVAMKYKGGNGFDIAARKANDWCRQHYGSPARLLADDLKGHARFECVE